MARTLFALALLLTAFGCKEFGSNLAGDIKFADNADTNLQRGNEALTNKNFQEAEKYFEYVKAKYPFLEAAKIAELRLADTNFEKEQYAEARDQYLNFVKLHPAHASVDYAAFRAALTHYKEIPSDFFLLPPSEEKDQVEVKGALKAMTDFNKQYPKSQYVAESEKVADDCRKRLVQHELYVARFYFKRERWGATAARLEGLLADYKDLPLRAEVALLIHDTYEHLNAPAKGKDALKKLIDRFPDSEAARRAQKLLGS